MFTFPAPGPPAHFHQHPCHLCSPPRCSSPWDPGDPLCPWVPFFAWGWEWGSFAERTALCWALLLPTLGSGRGSRCAQSTPTTAVGDPWGSGRCQVRIVGSAKVKRSGREFVGWARVGDPGVLGRQPDSARPRLPTASRTLPPVQLRDSARGVPSLGPGLRPGSGAWGRPATRTHLTPLPGCPSSRPFEVQNPGGPPWGPALSVATWSWRSPSPPGAGPLPQGAAAFPSLVQAGG